MAAQARGRCDHAAHAPPAASPDLAFSIGAAASPAPPAPSAFDKLRRTKAERAAAEKTAKNKAAKAAAEKAAVEKVAVEKAAAEKRWRQTRVAGLARGLGVAMWAIGALYLRERLQTGRAAQVQVPASERMVELVSTRTPLDCGIQLYAAIAGLRHARVGKAARVRSVGHTQSTHSGQLAPCCPGLVATRLCCLMAARTCRL
jgi:hypothetical protein